MDIDLGDVTLSLNVRVKGIRPVARLIWRVGPFSDTTPAERTPGPAPTYKSPPGKVDIYMDLKADQRVSFALQAQDEAGNAVPLGDGTSVSFNVDDPSILTLVDNGDGSGSVTATGTLGLATLTGLVTFGDGRTATGVAAVQVVAGDAETFAISFDTPEEATPDGEPVPTPEA